MYLDVSITWFLSKATRKSTMHPFISPFKQKTLLIASFTCKVVRICLQVSERQIQIGLPRLENHEANWGWNLAKLLTWFSTQELMMVAVDQNSTINNQIVKTCENYLIAGRVQKKKTVGQKLQISPYPFHHPFINPWPTLCITTLPQRPWQEIVGCPTETQAWGTKHLHRWTGQNILQIYIGTSLGDH